MMIEAQLLEVAENFKEKALKAETQQMEFLSR
jgi:hypothetical protein